MFSFAVPIKETEFPTPGFFWPTWKMLTLTTFPTLFPFGTKFSETDVTLVGPQSELTSLRKIYRWSETFVSVTTKSKTDITIHTTSFQSFFGFPCSEQSVPFSWTFTFWTYTFTSEVLLRSSVPVVLTETVQLVFLVPAIDIGIPSSSGISTANIFRLSIFIEIPWTAGESSAILVSFLLLTKIEIAETIFWTSAFQIPLQTMTIPVKTRIDTVRMFQTTTSSAVLSVDAIFFLKVTLSISVLMSIRTTNTKTKSTRSMSATLYGWTFMFF